MAAFPWVARLVSRLLHTGRRAERTAGRTYPKDIMAIEMLTGAVPSDEMIERFGKTTLGVGRGEQARWR